MSSTPHRCYGTSWSSSSSRMHTASKQPSPTTMAERGHSQHTSTSTQNSTHRKAPPLQNKYDTKIQEGLPPCTTPAEARLFMGKFLRQVDHELARDCASGILKPAATRGDDRRDQNDRRDSRRGGDGTPEKPPKRPRHDDRDAIRRADKADKNAVSPDKNKKPYICFLEDPRNSKTCPEGSKCTKLHLNTTIKEEADRYDKALAAHEASKASRADRKKKVT